MPGALLRLLAVLLVAWPTAAAAQVTFGGLGATGANASSRAQVGVADDPCSDDIGVVPPQSTSAGGSSSCASTATENGGTIDCTAQADLSVSISTAGIDPESQQPIVTSITVSGSAQGSANGSNQPPSGVFLGTSNGSAFTTIHLNFKAPTPYTFSSGGGSASGSYQASGVLRHPSANFAAVGFHPTQGSMNTFGTSGTVPGPRAWMLVFEARGSSDTFAGSATPESGASSLSFTITFGAGPTPTPTPTPTPSPTPTATSGVVRWVNAGGGNFGVAANWDPPLVPERSDERADTALFDLPTTYTVVLADPAALTRQGLPPGRTTARALVRNGVLNLVNGSYAIRPVGAEHAIGVGGGATLSLFDAEVDSFDMIVGDVAGTPAQVFLNLVGDQATTLALEGRLFVGDQAPGSLSIGANSEVTSLESRIGNAQHGSVDLVGGNNGWTTGNLAVGLGGKGTLVIEDGGQVDGDEVFVGFGDVAGSRVTIDGSGNAEITTRLTGTTLVIGNGAPTGVGDFTPESELRVLGAGRVEVVDLEVARGGDALVLVDGVDGVDRSLVEVSDLLTVGSASGTDLTSPAVGLLNVVGGALVHARRAAIGLSGFSVATVAGTGPNDERSTLQVDQELEVGRFERGILEIGFGGLVDSGPGVVRVFGPNAGLVFVGNSENAEDPISTWKVVGDLTIGSDDGASGSVHVGERGEVQVLGNATAVRVLAGGELSGGGAIAGDVVVAGGRLAPTLDEGPRSLAITGDLTAQSGTVDVFVTGRAAGERDTIAVTGDVTLGGTLEVVFAEDFLPQAGDTFTFFQVGGTLSGSFAQVVLRGVREDLPFTVTTGGIEVGAAALAAPGRGPLPLQGLTITTLADAAPCAVPDQDGDGVAECEVCDNCLDDNGNGLVDGADPDCVSPADAGGAALPGTAEARKALVACQKGIRAAASKLASGYAKGFGGCAGAVAGCLQTKPGDGACLAKATTTCAKATAKLGDGADTLATTFGAKVTKACGPPNALSDLLAAEGLGFATAAARCARFGVGALDGIDALARCLARVERCRVVTQLGRAMPRLAELVVAGGVSGDLVACGADGAHGGPAGTGAGAKAGKALLKCQKAIAAAAAKLGAAIEKARSSCAAGVLACRQLVADPSACTTKSAAKCQAGAAKLGDAAAGTGAAEKAIAAVTKSCAAVPFADVLASAGLGFASATADCAARGITPLDSPTQIAHCLAHQVTCTTTLRLESELPRLRELLELGGTPLP